MRIKDRLEFMSKAPVLTFAPDAMVIDAVHAMSEKNYGACVVVNAENKPVGIITERDFMRRLLHKSLDAHTTPIRDIMSTELKLAHPEDKVVDWIRVMSNERFRHLPVVDDTGRLLNVMSQGDFISYTWPQLMVKIKDEAVKSFIERYHLYLLLGGVMLYTIVMMFVIGAHN
jgi:CBS domain-containing protein